MFLLMEAAWFILSSRVVFLDRDGVINEPAAAHDYIKKWDEFHFINGTPEAIHDLNMAGLKVIHVTNQRGIARNLMTMEDLEDIHCHMKEKLKEDDAFIDDIFVCPHEEGTCNCRKPKTGLFLQAEHKYNVDKMHSYMVGDSETDIQAGKNYGVRTVSIGSEDLGANHKCRNLLEAVQWIIEEEKQ